MLLLRWIFFFPALLLVTAAVQTVGGIVGEQGPWWIWFFVYLGFGWGASAWAVFLASRICPNPMIGSYMFLGIFLVAEILAFFQGFSGRTALENIIRGGIDIAIVGSLVASANTPSNKSNA